MPIPSLGASIHFRLISKNSCGSQLLGLPQAPLWGRMRELTPDYRGSAGYAPAAPNPDAERLPIF
jgi:hypothetical protein